MFYRFYNDFDTFVVSAAQRAGLLCLPAARWRCSSQLAAHSVRWTHAGVVLNVRQTQHAMCSPLLAASGRSTSPASPAPPALPQYGHAAHLDHELHEEEHGSHDDEH